MKNGQVYDFFGDRVKVLIFDDKEVFWDQCTIDNIILNSKRKSMIFQRTLRSFFVEKAVLLNDISLTNEEKEKYHSHLPLRLVCIDNIFWSHQSFSTLSRFQTFAEGQKIDFDQIDIFPLNQIVLIPSGQQQSQKTSQIVSSQQDFFSIQELLYHAFNIQQPHINQNKPYFTRFRLIKEGREEKRLRGIGLYRSGLKSGLPSYYLGGAISWNELETNDTYLV